MRGKHLGWALVLSLIGHGVAAAFLVRSIPSRHDIARSVAPRRFHELEIIATHVAPPWIDQMRTSPWVTPVPQPTRNPTKRRRINEEVHHPRASVTQQKPSEKADAQSCAPYRNASASKKRIVTSEKGKTTSPASPKTPAESPAPAPRPKPRLVDVTVLDAIPKPVFTVKPKIPPMLVATKGRGLVILRVLIGPSGRVESIRVVKSVASLGLDRPAIEAVRKWRYSKPTVKGRSVSAWLNQPILFNAAKQL